MRDLLPAEESERFESLWQQYADLVYNLAVRLTCSPKKGWLLSRAAFLDARRLWSTLEGTTPTVWLYRILINDWYTPYLEQKMLWRRLTGKRTIRWETSLAHSVNADLIFLSEQQEALLEWLKRLDYPQRLVAVLQFGYDFSVQEIASLTPLGEHKIKGLMDSAAARLMELLQASGVSKPAHAGERIEKIKGVFRQWQPMKAPLTLKVDIMNRRIEQQRIVDKRIPDSYSQKDILVIFFITLFLLVASFAYYWTIGRRYSAPVLP